ncbi:MAG: hypothetical protein K8R69_01300 [Deltaproteobacteria bacterium]|nr:hypothetical protein [Deltaproteobacteria bacterium]
MKVHFYALVFIVAWTGISLGSKAHATEPIFPVDIGCGNGVTEKGETCDDGNYADGDGCDHLCQNEAKLIFPVDIGCGNGVVEKGEECDDGDDVDGDGCDHLCKFETKSEATVVPEASVDSNLPMDATAPSEVSSQENGIEVSSIVGAATPTNPSADMQGWGCSLGVVSGDTAPLASLLSMVSLLPGVLFLRRRRT